MALELCGSRSDVASTTEQSRAAEVCRLWFGPTRDLVLCAAAWNNATAYSRLALLSERDDTLQWDGSVDPAPGFQFSHEAPSDMLRPRYLSTYERFRSGTNGTKRVINSQTESPILIYTKSLENPQLWEHELAMAIVHGLAGRICAPLNGKRALAKDLIEQANVLLLQARASNANDNWESLETIPEWISARGAAYSGPTLRYYYPFGPMLALTEVPGAS